jgi:NAD(P)-dependent dehydrogenase (short-subunit alcohol dehydrogenase family)
MDLGLKNKVAVVTGGSVGIGLAIAEGLAAEGVHLALAARGADRLRDEAKRIAGQYGVRVAGIVCDVAAREGTDALIAGVKQDFGGADILINNAGTNEPQAIDQITDETWDRVMEINLNSIMVLTRAIVPQMKQRKWGRIVHISSIMGIVSKEKRNVYSVTKTGLIGFAHASALDLGEFGITVNCIAPGPFMTDLPMSLLSDKEKADFARMTAMNRWGDPKELVGPALLLVSDAGSYITGATLVVDGGYILR